MNCVDLEKRVAALESKSSKTAESTTSELITFFKGFLLGCESGPDAARESLATFGANQFSDDLIRCHEEILTHGTSMKIEIKATLDNCNPSDTQEACKVFSLHSRDFYLELGRNINSAP